jgi:hypothetical protein
VHPVHIRRHDKEAQEAVQGQGQFEIAVVEHCCPVEDYLKKNYRENGRAEGNKGGQSKMKSDFLLPRPLYPYRSTAFSTRVPLMTPFDP